MGVISQGCCGHSHATGKLGGSTHELGGLLACKPNLLNCRTTLAWQEQICSSLLPNAPTQDVNQRQPVSPGLIVDAPALFAGCIPYPRWTRKHHESKPTELWTHAHLTETELLMGHCQALQLQFERLQVKVNACKTGGTRPSNHIITNEDAITAVSLLVDRT